jgi:uncharacterized protein (TIGR02996 family)
VDAEAFIAAIVAEPSAVEPVLRYADWLLERDDPRGELIQLQLAVEGGSNDLKREISWLLWKDEERLLSPNLAEHHHHWKFAWWRGFITGAHVLGAADDPPTVEAVRALLDDPHSALLRELCIEHPVTQTVPLWQPVLADTRPSITKLLATDLAEGGVYLDRLPRLVELVLGPGRIGDRKPWELFCFHPARAIAHERVRTLHAHALSCPALVNGEATLPSLEVLTWELEPDPRTPAIDPLLASSTSLLRKPPPRLVELRLWHQAQLSALADCAVLPQLRTLRLEYVPDTAIAELCDHAPRLKHLARIDVKPASGELPAAVIDSLRNELARALPNTQLAIPWDRIVAGERDVDLKRKGTDASSRNAEGFIDALEHYSTKR